MVLPTIGTASFPEAPGPLAEVRRIGADASASAGGRIIRIGDAAAEGWRSTPVLTAEADGANIRVFLDDVDPYRDFRGGMPPKPLPADDVARWRQLLKGAWPLLVAQNRPHAEAIAAAVISIDPLPATESHRPYSGSSNASFAGVRASMPNDDEQCAETLVHETRHVTLGALLQLKKFIDADDGPLLYAPWRDDPRPLSGQLQGVYAFVGITGFWRQRSGPAATFEFALRKMQVDRVLAALGEETRLSPDGRALIAGLSGTAATWSTEPVAPEATRLAADATADHYAQWRMLHMPAPRDWVTAAANAWRHGRPCPPVPIDPRACPVTDVRARDLDGRAILIRRMLRDRAEFDARAGKPAFISETTRGTLPPDAALFSGDPERARNGYLARLADEPRNRHAWSGLGLTLRALGDPASTLLLERPELINAVLAECAGAGTTELVAWMWAAAR